MPSQASADLQQQPPPPSEVAVPEDDALTVVPSPPEIRGLRQLLCSLSLDERLGAATAFCITEGAVRMLRVNVDP